MGKGKGFLIGHLFIWWGISVWADQPLTAPALTLLDVSAPRPASMGEAFTAARNDLSAFNFNPASLNSLRYQTASFFYHRGFVDDALSQIQMGFPSHRHCFGLSLLIYDGGRAELTNGGGMRSVTIQKDWVFMMGYARSVGILDLGLSGKFLSSELGQRTKATAYAFDGGLLMPLGSKFDLGASFQNFGTHLQYGSISEDLPRLSRLGISYRMIPRFNFFWDETCLFNQRDLFSSLGCESDWGVMALRTGYRFNTDSGGFSVGTGIRFRRIAIDYSYQFVDELDSPQRISVSMTFGPEVSR